MSGSASLSLEQALLGHSLAFAPMAFPAQVFVGLCLAAIPPSETIGGQEISGGGYVRVRATFALTQPPTNFAGNVASVEFPQSIADWGTLGYFELWDAQAGGNRLYWGAIVDPTTGQPVTLAVPAGDIVRFSSGTLVIQATTGTGGTTSLGGYLPLTGGTLTGPLLLAADPSALLGAATKQYVDAHSGTGGGTGYLPIGGGTMTGPLTLAGVPTAFGMAANKQYVDNAVVGALTWIATGTSAPRTAQDRSADQINVKNYGAKLDGVTDDSAAFNAAYAAALASPGTPAIYVPRGGMNFPSFTTGTTKQVLWKLDGNTYGTGTFPFTVFGDGDVTESFFGDRVSYGKKLINSTNYFATVSVGVDVANPTPQPSGVVASALLLSATSEANTGAGVYTWTLNTQLNSRAMGGANNQDVATASSVYKYGSATTWQYFGNSTDYTGLPINGSIVCIELDIFANGPEYAQSSYNPAFGGRTFIEFDPAPNTFMPAWQAGHAYSINDAIQPTPANGYTYVCTVAGTSAATQPVWPTTTGTVTDGSVTWKYGTTINMQVSRAMGIGGSANAQFGAGLFAGGYFYDAILEFSGATLVDGGVKDAAIRLAANHPIDFSGDLTDAGQNLRTLRYSSSRSLFLLDGAGLEVSGGPIQLSADQRINLEITTAVYLCYSSSTSYITMTAPLHLTTNFSSTGTPLQFSNLPTNASNDTVAQSFGVPVGGVYRNGSVLMVRVL